MTEQPTEDGETEVQDPETTRSTSDEQAQSDESNRRGPLYEGNVVPFAHSGGDHLKNGWEQWEIILPVEIMDQTNLRRPHYTLSDDDQEEEERAGEDESERRGSLVRYMYGIEDGEIVIIIDTTPATEGRDRVFGTERRVAARPDNYHSLLRLPQSLVEATGLNVPVDNDTDSGDQVTGRVEGYYTGRDVELDVRDEAIVASFDPSIPSILFPAHAEEAPTAGDGMGLEQQTVTLQAVRQRDENWEGGTVPATPEHIDSYQLRFPFSYQEAYDLTSPRDEASEGESVPAVVTLGVVEDTVQNFGETHTRHDPALIMDFHKTSGKNDRGVQRPISTDVAGYVRKGEDFAAEKAEFQSDPSNVPSLQAQAYCTPGKALLNAIGIGVGEPDEEIDRRVRLYPGDGRIAICPADPDSVFDPLADG